MKRGVAWVAGPGRIALVALAGLGLAVAAIAGGLVGDLRQGAAHGLGLRLDELLFALGAVLVAIVAEAAFNRRSLLRELARRRGQERDARALASRDPLTGLLNRRGMIEIATRHRGARQRVLLLCDLDGFKQVNDTYGHKVGDEVLRRTGRRLATIGHAKVSIEAVRLGGDEFVLLAAGDAINASALARDVIRVTAEPFEIDGVTIQASASVGAATSAGDEPLEDLLGMADDAMYQAKRNGLPVRMVSGSHGYSGRRMFEQQIDSRATERTLFAAAIGIDRIREMRHALGYGLGSRLVRELTQRLGLLDDQLYFERLSSDVLGIAFRAVNRDEACGILDRLRQGVEGPVTLAGASVDLRLTIGLAGPGQPVDIRDLTEQAQAALEDAWRTGARLKRFEESDQAAASENIGLMADLRGAIAQNALEVHYQPKLRLKTGEIESVEALVRWNHPLFGAIPPSRFVPIAEKTGDVRELTHWVIERVLADRGHIAAGGHDPVIYINISADLIADDVFAEMLFAKLSPLAGAIGIEITETAVLASPERALPNLNRLAEAGIKIAIDDYGVGLSSLAYLKQLPAAELKLDMMFVSNLATSHRDPMIARSTIELAHGLGLLVTAEGVDSMESFALLKVMGCDLLQGFAISKPLPADELGTFLAQHDASGASANQAIFDLRIARAA